MHSGTPTSRARLMALVFSITLSSGCLVSTAPAPIPPPAELGPAQIAAREQIIISQLRSLKQAEDLHMAKEGKFGTVNELKAAGAINQDPAMTGYYMDVTIKEDGAKYHIFAVPKDYGPGGRRSFYMDQTGVIRGADHNGGAPSETDPPV